MMKAVVPMTSAWPAYFSMTLWLNLRIVIICLHLYYRSGSVLALYSWDADDLAIALVAVTFAEVVIQMLLISELFNSAVVIP
jgi:hypothetical protein